MRSDELLKQEEELATAEAAMAGREAAQAVREREGEAALARARDRLGDLEEKLRALAKAGSPEADAFLRNLPELPPGPGVSDRSKAVNARRETVEVRTASLAAREKAIALVQAGAGRVDGALNGAVAEANRIEAEFASRKRQDALARKAASQAPALAQPPPLAAAAALGSVTSPQRPPTSPGGIPRLQPAPAGPPRLQPGPPPVPAGPAPVGRIATGKKDEPARRQSRIRIDADVSFESESNFFAGFARNLSEGGLFVAAWDYAPVGTELDVAFTIPGGTRIEAKAVVRWVREMNDTTPDVWPGMGVEFLSLPPGADAAIHRYMSEREPLFFTE